MIVNQTLRGFLRTARSTYSVLLEQYKEDYRKDKDYRIVPYLGEFSRDFFRLVRKVLKTRGVVKTYPDELLIEAYNYSITENYELWYSFLIDTREEYEDSVNREFIGLPNRVNNYLPLFNKALLKLEIIIRDYYKS